MNIESVNGNTYVNGGGKNNIQIHGNDLTNVIIEKSNNTKVRVLSNDTTIRVLLSKNTKGQDIILFGHFDSILVLANDLKIITRANTKIQNITVRQGLNNVQLQIAQNSETNRLILDSKAVVKGKGTIDEAGGDAANQSSFEIPPKKIIQQGEADVEVITGGTL